jgi:hypothetical protein
MDVLVVSTLTETPKYTAMVFFLTGCLTGQGDTKHEALSAVQAKCGPGERLTYQLATGLIFNGSHIPCGTIIGGEYPCFPAHLDSNGSFKDGKHLNKAI